MNRTNEKTESISRSTLPGRIVWLKTICSILFSACISMCLFGGLDERVLGLFCVLVAFLAVTDLFFGISSPKYSVFCLLIGIAASFFTSNLVVGVCIVAFILSISDLAFAITFSSKKLRILFPILVPVVSYGVALLFSHGNFITSLLSLIFFPAALVLAYSTVKKTPRVSTIVRISASIAIPVIILAAVAFYSEFGTLSFDAIRNFVNEFREVLADEIINAYDSVANSIASGPSGKTATGKAVGTAMPQGLSRQAVNEMLSGIINLSPAVFIITTNLLSFLAHGINLSRMRRMKASLYLGDEVEFFNPSVFAPIVMLTAFVVTLFTSGGNSRGELVASIVCQNIFSVLELTMGLYGLASVFGRTRSKAKLLPPIFPIILLLLILIFSPSGFISACAFWGAASRIFSAIVSSNKADNGK